MKRKVEKVGAVKTGRNGSRSERKLGVSCMGGLLVARVPGCPATPRIHPSRKEVAIPHAYPAPGKVRNLSVVLPEKHPCRSPVCAPSGAAQATFLRPLGIL